MQTPWMSVVVPAYNEEEAIGATLDALRGWLDAAGRPYEIVVVDNASQDGTAEVVRGLRDERVRLLVNDVNRGKGFSVRRGMLETTGELRLLCDADCGPSLASLGRMVQATSEVHVVVGSRVAEGAEVGRSQPFHRRLVGWPFIALTRLLMAEPTRDVYCGFKLWHGAAADAVFALQTLEGWTFDAEVLALARRLGFQLREIGIAWADRDGSRLSIRQVLLPVVRELLAARRNVRRQEPGSAALLAAPTLPSEPRMPEPAAGTESAGA
jgi:glycosyltransferase involved in cell wall biosynthesis